MIGLIFIAIFAYAIGQVAFDKGRTPWHFWLITVGVWYVSQFLFAFLFTLIYSFFATEALTPMAYNGIGIGGGAIGLGLLYVYVSRLTVLESEDDLIDQIGEEIN